MPTSWTAKGVRFASPSHPVCHTEYASNTAVLTRLPAGGLHFLHTKYSELADLNNTPSLGKEQYNVRAMYLLLFVLVLTLRGQAHVAHILEGFPHHNFSRLISLLAAVTRLRIEVRQACLLWTLCRNFTLFAGHFAAPSARLHLCSSSVPCPHHLGAPQLQPRANSWTEHATKISESGLSRLSALHTS